MRVPLSMIQKFIDVPQSGLRAVFDDLGLEVENMVTENGETMISIETLAHRGDHISALGIAREFSARYLQPLRPLDIVRDWKKQPLSRHVSVQATSCLRYALMQVEGVQPQVIVPCLNTICVEIGQPMHAFDADKVEGAIRVVMNEKAIDIEALDGKKYEVPPGAVLIQDENKIIAVAGVIGCANTMVTDDTKTVLIESATFDPVTIRKTARSMKISTDASYIFERGSDCENVMTALQRALAILGRDEAPVFYYQGASVVSCTIYLSLKKMRDQLNMPSLSIEEIEKRLSYLGYTVGKNAEELLEVIPPSWRQWNVKTAESVVEDFARAFGLNNIPYQLPALDYAIPPLHLSEKVLASVEPILVGSGFIEVMTKSYYSGESVSYLQEVNAKAKERHIAIKNSIEKEYSYLKTTNIIHLAKVAEFNTKKNVPLIKLYECARLYDKAPRSDTYQSEWDVLSLAVASRWYGPLWKESEDDVLYLFKGVLESILQTKGRMSIGTSSVSYLHPLCQACLFLDSTECGFFGRIHPLLKEKLGLSCDVVYAQIDIEKLAQTSSEAHSPVFSDFPSIKRDLTLPIPKTIFASDVIQNMHSLHPQYLQDVSIVDCFQKEDEEFRRITYRLTFQSTERTLLKEEVDAAMDTLLAEMKAWYQLELVD